jgi:hypothetical protein
MCRSELERIINKSLEKDRNLRYQHASEMRSDLQRLKRDTETGRAIAAGSGSVPVAASAPRPDTASPIFGHPFWIRHYGLRLA